MRWFLVVVMGVLMITSCTKQSEQSAMVESGLDVLESQGFELLRGKRVGLITNQTGIDRRGTHVADLLFDAEGVELTTLFGPEHGIRGQADEKIPHGKDPKTGLPIYSLYSDTRKPTPEMLQNVDVLVFDIQDIGTRFYTYISTMSLAMEAAAEQGIEFVVLDRPNPIGGVAVEGPVLDLRYRSFVGRHPIALRHGMTVGELATMFNSEGWLEGGVQAKLTVVKMRGWQRDMFFEETGLPWVRPSPNMPNVDAALLYPGVALLEATNFSEGRGTTRPFELVGAPWIDSGELIRKLQSYAMPGISFKDTSFVPVDMPGFRMNPKFEGELCQAVLFRLTDRHAFRPVTFGIQLLSALQELYPQHFVMRDKAMARLSGVDWVREWILDGRSPEEIVANWQEELERFEELRRRYLLY
jgi:uncharacterized protein YbbC (DUF1343 family)